MNTYETYSPQVQIWMQKLVNNLKEELDEIPISYEVSLDLLADAFETYLDAKYQIQKHGILIESSRGDYIKNPALSALNSSQLFISKLLSQFALTRMSKSKLKENKDNNDVQELIKNLTD